MAQEKELLAANKSLKDKSNDPMVRFSLYSFTYGLIGDILFADKAAYEFSVTIFNAC